MMKGNLPPVRRLPCSAAATAIFFAMLASASVARAQSPAPAAAACDGVDTADGVRGVRPSTFNDGVDPRSDCDLYVIPGKPNGYLFVFIDGTGTNTSTYQDILKLAAADGYYAVSISYPNTHGIDSTCPLVDPASEGPGIQTCAYLLRKTIVEGDDSAKDLTENGKPLGIHISKDDSIHQRLKDFINGMGWSSAFIGRDGDVAWSKVSVAGHSQGSGHALLIGKFYPVDNVAIFSGVEDRVTGDKTTPAPWLAVDASPTPWSTPPNSIHAFIAADDRVANQAVPGDCASKLKTESTAPTPYFDHYIDTCYFSYQGWKSLGLPAANFFTGYYSPASTYNPTPNLPSMPDHMSTVADAYTRGGRSGAPAYKRIWEAVAFPRKNPSQ